MVVIDPVCFMEVDTETAAFTSEYRGQKYYFCSPGCKRDFDNNPASYINQDSTQGAHPSDMGGSS